MNLTIDQLNQLRQAKEGENVEFKEARNNFHFDKLVKYCVALANEGGGKIVFGVSDKRPRAIVGSTAFPQPERTRAAIIERVHVGVDFALVNHPDGRVLVFSVPSRPVGIPVKDGEGVYWARSGDRLVPMSETRLRAIFAESGHDFSADVCSDALITDLDPAAIDDFRRRLVAAKSGDADRKSVV